MKQIVLGPPGTGKTTTLLSIVDEELAKGTDPKKIGYVSFTKRAAAEAITRACEKFKKDRKEFPFFRTLHSLCFWYLGLRKTDVLEGAKLQEFARYSGLIITGKWSEDGTLTGYEVGDRCIYYENMARVRCIPLREQFDFSDGELSWDVLQKAAKDLNAFKAAHGLLDFTDMLQQFVETGQPPDLDVLLVDEAQDLSELQWRVVEILAKSCRRIVIAGDDDQAIYAWAGANVNRLIDMKGDVRVLNQSYRVPADVQTLANKLIRNMKHRRDKKWKSRKGQGTVVTTDQIHNVDFGGTSSFLVLARNEYILRPIEGMLRRQGIIFERRGHSSLRASYVEAIYAWEKLRKGQKITAAEARQVYMQMSAGVGYARGNKTLPGVPDEYELDITEMKSKHGLLRDDLWSVALDRLPAEEMAYMTVALSRGERLRGGTARVRLSTIHSAKGAEADHVVLMLEMARRSAREAEKNPDDELRVWYVGVTRAKHQLTLVRSPTNLECPWL